MNVIDSKSRTAPEVLPVLASANDLTLTTKKGASRARRDYQHEVANLLQAISQGVARLERLRALGLRGRALAEQESELSATRHELAELVRVREHERASLQSPPPRDDAPPPAPSKCRQRPRAWALAYR